MDYSDPGDGVALGSATPPALITRTCTRTRPRAGDTVLVGQAFENSGPAAEPEPIAVAGRVKSWNAASKKARIEWHANADGDRERDSTIHMPASQCVGVSSTPHGALSEGKWAFYDGPDTRRGKVLQRVVASKPRRQHDGAVLNMFRCRQAAIGPGADVWRSRAALLLQWPDDGDDALATFAAATRSP